MWCCAQRQSCLVYFGLYFAGGCQTLKGIMKIAQVKKFKNKDIIIVYSDELKLEEKLKLFLATNKS